MALTTKEKAVRREICQITCKGTEVCGLQDNGPTGANLNYMFAISESVSKIGYDFNEYTLK